MYYNKYNKYITINDDKINKINKTNKPVNINVNNIIDYYLTKPLPIKKNKNKISKEEFIIPKYEEYENIILINYNILQYKAILKYYNHKITGNKDELKKRIYNLLYYSLNAIIIQKNFRLFIIKRYIVYHGPGFYDKTKCVNDTDFYNLDNIITIPYTQFFSFQDQDNYIYGFDIKSIYNLYIKKTKEIENPYTKKSIPNNVYYNLIKLLKYSKILNIDVDIDLSGLKELDENKKFEMKLLNLFQIMDSLGNYTNLSWFTNLNKYDIIKFIKELLDIWNYRANLSQNIKREICPPYGNPFNNLNLHFINNTSFNNIRKISISIIEEFITKGINNDSKSLGCYYILSALTLVSSEAAEALPWLHEAVIYN